MSLTPEEKRESYLKKIKTVELINLSKNSGAEVEPPASTSSYSTPIYTPNYQNQTIAVSGDLFTFPESAFTMEELRKYPNIAKDYARHQVKVNKNIDINTAMPNGKIQLPTGSRASFTATSCKMIYERGGIANCGLYKPMDESIFSMSINRDYPYANWIRKDFEYYLTLLYEMVAPKIGVKKLKINSAYRSPAHNYSIYVSKPEASRVYWSVHMSGCAVDIGATGDDRYKIRDAAMALGFGGIGVGNGFVHLDIGPRADIKY